MTAQGDFQPKPFLIDFHSPRLRNTALYAFTILSSMRIHEATAAWDLLCCSPLVIAGLALTFYGFAYHMLNPDALNFHEHPEIPNEPIYNTKITRKDIILKPLLQPIKDIYNLAKLRHIRI